MSRVHFLWQRQNAEQTSTHTAAAVFENHFTHIHESNCRKASRTSRSSFQNGNYPPRTSFVPPLIRWWIIRLFSGWMIARWHAATVSHPLNACKWEVAMHVQSQASQQYCAGEILCNLFLFQIHQIVDQVLFYLTLHQSPTQYKNLHFESIHFVTNWAGMFDVYTYICVSFFLMTMDDNFYFVHYYLYKHYPVSDGD